MIRAQPRHPFPSPILALAWSAFTLSLLLPSPGASASDIPYADVDQTVFSPNSPQATHFLSNPVAMRAGVRGGGDPKDMMASSNEVALPPLPDALRPLGPAKVAPAPRTESIIAELPAAHGLGMEPVPSKAKEHAGNDGGDLPEADVVQETPAPKPASNAFLDWVRAHRDAEELAKQQRGQYNADGSPASDAKTKGKAREEDGTDGDGDDLLLHIRYPYTWNQEAPSGHGSSVIYTVPQR
ncbi:hypothetical protein SAMN05444156_1371 [Verrucomicrobium sp. GAS474]|uniref:hypothetical protein n=1 Tax=Verrucomicrobium sp. GAS474 TaxID=1882831 RepID=UPI00087A025C|nr:hypothetical protein [Verrucomicrobium sp. GAS474]SDU00221.1 hypothetical protein SAMN05444156_1371 [Verrucomicrobium sp. GAS474]